MRLHFADSGKERGQFAILGGVAGACSLLSYHYAKVGVVMRAYELLWELQQEAHVNLHLTGYGPVGEALSDATPRSTLVSYAYRQEAEDRGAYGRLWHAQADLVEDLRPRVLIDSGAFTAWSSGNPVVPKVYGEWALRFREEWEERMAFLRFINLDVIGDQEGTWKNQRTLEKMGLDPIPVITQGADLSHLDAALEEYPYVCLGGLVPLAQRKKKMAGWLDRCFARVVARWKATGVMPKVHLLGVTQAWVLDRYPAFSSDSSSWTAALRYGASKSSGLPGVPRIRLDSQDDVKGAVAHALRSEIRRLKVMEEQATALWKSRGVVWED